MFLYSPYLLFHSLTFLTNPSNVKSEAFQFTSAKVSDFLSPYYNTTYIALHTGEFGTYHLNEHQTVRK